MKMTHINDLVFNTKTGDMAVQLSKHADNECISLHLGENLPLNVIALHATILLHKRGHWFATDETFAEMKERLGRFYEVAE